jgi:sterol desaturase/sphingolipid hydroxylase (fatty acid hydroxylase superfamily)
MEAYASVLTVAIPLFLTLVVIEALAAKRMKVAINREADVISSFSSGVTNAVKEVLGLTVVIVSYTWLVGRVALVHIQGTWLVYLVGFVALDFAGYWRHRIHHEINLLWNQHIVHHSSEEFNLSCGFRRAFTEIVSFFNLFFIPAALFGIPGEVIAVILPLHLFGQFWYHTRLIDKMGWLESWFVTPSHHRVHHAINREYLDKNYGNIFIFWDKWFGTFQAELRDVPPVYGTKRPMRTWNPILINFRHLALLCQDAWRTASYWDKFRIWFMPTGWRPPDVIEPYPVPAVNDVSAYVKYDSAPSEAVLKWSWGQLAITVVLLFDMLSRFTEIGFPGVIAYGVFLFATIFSYCALLDKMGYALAAEVFRGVLALVLIWWQGDWFGLEDSLPGSILYFVLYLLGSLVGTAYFYVVEITGRRALG